MVPELSLGDIADSLFSKPPRGILYHYTSLRAFTEIVRTGRMFASDIRYLNDAAELSHTLNLLREALKRRERAVERIGRAGGNISAMMAPEFLSFLDEMIDGRGCHVVCFTRNGNQLSQWRGYCPTNRGISIGFDADDLEAAGKAQGFTLRECIYDRRRQRTTAGELLDGMHVPHPSGGTAKHNHEAFEAFQKIAAVLKHPRFKEERECRLLSHPRLMDSPFRNVKHREGKAMLILNKVFELPRARKRLKIAKVILGPTPHARQALRSVQQFLMAQKLTPKAEYCDIPLREA